MSAHAHLRPVGTSAAAPPALERIAEVRTEWGHRLAATYPGREQYADRDEISWCRDPHTLERRTTPCDRTTVMGLPIDHIWRRVIVTTWQDGQP